MSISDKESVNNFPDSETYTYGILAVFRATNITVQIYIPNSSGKAIWIRSNYAGNDQWEAWQSISKN